MSQEEEVDAIGKLREARIIPDVIPDTIENLDALDVLFRSTRNIEFGTEIRPKYLRQPPTLLRWDVEQGKLYTVVMLDIDEPSRNNPTDRSYINWMVANIPAATVGQNGSDIKSGTEVLNYERPASTQNSSGPHRIVLVVLEQTDRLEVDQLQRKNFNIINWADKNNCRLIGANFFVTGKENHKSRKDAPENVEAEPSGTQAPSPNVSTKESEAVKESSPKALPKEAKEASPKALSESSPKDTKEPSPKELSEFSPKVLPKDAEEPSPKAQSEPSPKASPKDASPKVLSEASPKVSPKEVKESPKALSESSPKASPKEFKEPSPKALSESSPKASPKDVKELSPKALSEPSPKASPKDASPKVLSEASPKVSPKEVKKSPSPKTTSDADQESLPDKSPKAAQVPSPKVPSPQE